MRGRSPNGLLPFIGQKLILRRESSQSWSPHGLWITSVSAGSYADTPYFTIMIVQQGGEHPWNPVHQGGTGWQGCSPACCPIMIVQQGVSAYTPFGLVYWEEMSLTLYRSKAKVPEQYYDRNETKWPLTLHPSDTDLLEKNDDRNEAQMASNPVRLKNCVSPRESW